jgi:hypothetical protein
MAVENDRSMKQILDGVALFPLIAGIVGMIVFAVVRNKRVIR